MSELKFLGTGSAFQTNLYNNTAYFIEGETLFLLDCGETSFAQLKQQPFFEKINQIYVVFTHTHSDHIGGLGQLVEYCENVLTKKLNIIVPNIGDNPLYKDINSLLDIFSISKDKYNFLTPKEIENKYQKIRKITFLPTEHAPELSGKCYSLIIETEEGPILYTSDSIDTKYINYLIEKKNYSKIYVDVTLTIPTVHLDLNILNEIVPKDQKEKVYCMHFDSQTCMERACEFGFNIAPSVAKDLSKEEPEFNYLKLDDKLILSNCGEMTFCHLKQKNILDDVDDIFLQLENTNHDQVASLGSLLTYCYFVKKKPLYILNDSQEIAEKLDKLVELYGTPKESIRLIKPLEKNIISNVHKVPNKNIKNVQ